MSQKPGFIDWSEADIVGAVIGERPFRRHGGPRREGEPAVQAAGQKFLARGFVQGASLFTEDDALWRGTAPARLNRALARPVANGQFLHKLKVCLQDQDEDVVLLAAELLFVCFLPVKDMLPATKRSRIDEVLSWRSTPVSLPDDALAALDFGVFNGGMGYTVQLWPNFRVLVEVVAGWSVAADTERARCARDPLAFRDFVAEQIGDRAAAERHALTYLAFPDVFEPIVNTQHRLKIRKAFAHLLPGPPQDVSADLLVIRNALEREAGDVIEYYVPPLKDVWDPPPPAASPVTAAPSIRSWWIGYGSVAEGWIGLPDPNPDEPPTPSDLDAWLPSTSGPSAVDRAAYRHLLVDMTAGDRICLTHAGQFFLGTLGAEVSQVTDPDDVAWLRRPAAWNDEGAIALDDLPPALAALTSTGAPIVELTIEHALLQSLIDQSDADTELLRDATDEIADKLLVPREWLDEVIALLRGKPQAILYGPPGTGKTWQALHLAEYLAGKERTTLVQFHPSYSYEDFFEGYRPEVDKASGALVFKLRHGPFRRVVDRARLEPDRPHFLVIDEINRGNLAKVFGELYFLLEYRNHNVELLYAEENSPPFRLPDNVFILGTMNTVDRSIALVDTAMRRRFSFVALHPAIEPTKSLLRRWLKKSHLPDRLARLLDALNSQFEDPDFRVGPSYFMGDHVQTSEGLALVWKSAILPLLEEAYYGTKVDVAKQFSLQKMLKLADGIPDDPTAAEGGEPALDQSAALPAPESLSGKPDALAAEPDAGASDE